MQDAKDNRETPRHSPPQSKGFVRVAPLAGMVPVLRTFGVEPEEVLQAYGLSASRFDDPDFAIPYVTGGRLLQHCAKTTKCSHFGLLVGMRALPSTLGIPGFLLQNAPDVGTALQMLAQNLDLHEQGGNVVFDRQGKAALLGYAIHQDQVEASEQIHDLALAVACNIMRHLCGAGWNPTAVCLSRSPPSDLRPYRRFYRAPVQFNIDRNTLEFPSRWLHHKIARADALLYNHLIREANELHRAQPANFRQDVRRLLRTSIMHGPCTVHEVAKQLCLHERTLHRRLSEENTNFQQELNTVRHEIARQLLSATSMPIVRIATALNYSSVSAFNRAFKRWTGSTPDCWRTEHPPSHDR
jgi:AraC-like DNA-binding protein